MPNRPNFPIPENIHAEPFCLCIKVPNDPTWKAVVNGLLDQLNQWYNWQRDDENSGRECAHVWRPLFNEIDWTTMSCCCGDNPPAIYRYVDNVYERSTDGGVTWEPAPQYDYRNTSLTWADPADIGVEYTKCQAADSVVATIRDDIVQAWSEDMTASGILAVVAAVALAFLTAGTSLAITAVAVGVGSAVIAAGVAAAQAAFTTDVWDEFRCMVFNRMNGESSIDQAGLDGLYADLDSFTGVVAPTLKGMVAAIGPIGLTNIMRELSGDPDATCDCDDEWCYEFDFTIDDYGWVAVGAGSYSAGVGFVGGPYGTGGGINALTRAFSSATVTAIGVTHSASGFGGNQKLVQWWGGGVDIDDQIGSGGMNGTDISTVFTQSTPLLMDEFRLFWDGAGSFDVTITYIIIRGTGENPFGSDNCD